MKRLLGLLILLVISDGLLTHFLVTDGRAWEGNPFLRPLVGDVGFILLKAAGVLICAVILWDIHRRFPKLALVSTWFFVVCYGAIVLWNLSIVALN